MINQKLMVSGADYFADTYEINPYYTQNKIDINKAMAEHKLILDCFKEANIELIKVKPPKNCQDGVYTANWALIKDGIAVMSRLPEARKAEENYARKIL
jgi:N-dimethylarginine dimethylaminohydrolase